MNIHDATEVSYKNGYRQALKDLLKELELNEEGGIEWVDTDEISNVIQRLLSSRGVSND